MSKGKRDVQLDSILPPEENTAWVQCDTCCKWRRVPWNIDVESLSDPWACHMNTWDPETARCEAAQDGWDPEKEAWVETNAQGHDTEDSITVISSI